MFDFLKQKTTSSELEKEIYRVVASELKNDEIDSVLWVKAFAESEGNRDKAKALYIKYRVNDIKIAAGQAAHDAFQTEQEMKQREKEQEKLEKQREKELRYRAKVAGAKYIKPKK